MISKNGIAGQTKESKKIKAEIDYWKQEQSSRKCTKFSKMSYWEVVTTNTAL